MKSKITVFVMILSLFCILAHADEVSHRAAAEELLLATKADKMLEPIWEQLKSMMEQQYAQMDAPEDARPILNKYSEKWIGIMKEELNWEKMKDDYIDIYVKTYTEEELRAISDFFKSPAGRKYIEKMPQLIEESMAVSQKNMPNLMTKLQKLTEEMTNEIIQFQEDQNE